MTTLDSRRQLDYIYDRTTLNKIQLLYKNEQDLLKLDKLTGLTHPT